MSNWRVFNVSAVDEYGQQFDYFSYADSHEAAIEDKQDQLRHLRVIDVHAISNGG